MPYITVPPGQKWHYAQAGQADSAETMLCIHGWSFDSTVWKRQSDFFSDKYNVVAVDLPGHGNTPYENPGDLSKGLAEFITALKLKKVYCAAHSLGGLVALRCACMNPEIFKCLVTVGSSAKFFQSEGYPFGLSMEDSKKLRSLLSQGYPAALSIFIRWLFTAQERSQKNFGKIWSALTKRASWPDREALIAFLGLLETEDLLEMAAKLPVPTLIISGSQDPICPFAVARNFQRVSGAQLVLFDDCGHLPFLTQPAKFNQVIDDFFHAN